MFETVEANLSLFTEALEALEHKAKDQARKEISNVRCQIIHNLNEHRQGVTSTEELARQKLKEIQDMLYCSLE